MFHLGWMLKKFQVGRYKFQVGVGGKTWKCVLIRVETCTKPIEIRHVLGRKNGEKCSNAKRFFQLKVEISTLVVLVTVFSISS